MDPQDRSPVLTGALVVMAVVAVAALGIGLAFLSQLTLGGPEPFAEGLRNRLEMGFAVLVGISIVGAAVAAQGRRLGAVLPIVLLLVGPAMLGAGRPGAMTLGFVTRGEWSQLSGPLPVALLLMEAGLVAMPAMVMMSRVAWRPSDRYDALSVGLLVAPVVFAAWFVTAADGRLDPNGITAVLAAFVVGSVVGAVPDRPAVVAVVLLALVLRSYLGEGAWPLLATGGLAAGIGAAHVAGFVRRQDAGPVVVSPHLS